MDPSDAICVLVIHEGEAHSAEEALRLANKLLQDRKDEIAHLEVVTRYVYRPIEQVRYLVRATKREKKI